MCGCRTCRRDTRGCQRGTAWTRHGAARTLLRIFSSICAASASLTILRRFGTILMATSRPETRSRAAITTEVTPLSCQRRRTPPGVSTSALTTYRTCIRVHALSQPGANNVALRQVHREQLSIIQLSSQHVPLVQPHHPRSSQPRRCSYGECNAAQSQPAAALRRCCNRGRIIAPAHARWMGALSWRCRGQLLYPCGYRGIRHSKHGFGAWRACSRPRRDRRQWPRRSRKKKKSPRGIIGDRNLRGCGVLHFRATTVQDGGRRCI